MADPDTISTFEELALQLESSDVMELDEEGLEAAAGGMNSNCGNATCCQPSEDSTRD